MRFHGNTDATKLYTLDLMTGSAQKEFLPVQEPQSVHSLLKIPEHKKPTQRQLGRLRFQLKRDREFQKAHKWTAEFDVDSLLATGHLAVSAHSTTHI